jgi:hypothetical protein
MVQTSLGAHSAADPKVSRATSPAVEPPVREPDHPSLPSAKAKKMSAPPYVFKSRCLVRQAQGEFYLPLTSDDYLPFS